ncbi:hypothetical protein, partial [Burkholderia sp. TSV86]|uniref:hypothetical protein n=1 Tax=Burkholderia sp. TSV86 TaxID=1385594 RepID=UPI0012E3ED55
MKQQLISIVILSVVQCTAYAQSACPSGTSNCSSQNMGDTTSQANNNQNHADQTGNTSNSNASGVDITGRNDLQQS